MNKQDLAIFVGLAEIANKAGLIGLDAFTAVGQSVAKAKSAIDAMSERDLLIIQKIEDFLKPPEAQEEPQEPMPPAE